jgi:hypothetical protein
MTPRQLRAMADSLAKEFPGANPFEAWACAFRAAAEVAETDTVPLVCRDCHDFGALNGCEVCGRCR